MGNWTLDAVTHLRYLTESLFLLYAIAWEATAAERVIPAAPASASRSQPA